MLVRYGSFLFRVGGDNASGIPQAGASFARIGQDGSLGNWTDTAPLPDGRSHGAIFAAANLLYVLGGEGPEGPSATIFYTAIGATGALGFGDSPGRWESNLRDLPKALTRAALAFHDGRLFLVGGEVAGVPVATIIHARLYSDGQVGHWYTNPLLLDSPRKSAATAVLGERLFVAGGAAAGSVLDEMWSFFIGSSGLLSDPRQEASLPQHLYSPILLADRDSLLAIGGFGTTAVSDGVYRFEGGAWEDQQLCIAAEGPSAGRAVGKLFYIAQAEGVVPTVVGDAALSLGAEVPSVVPGSGLVPNSVQLRAVPEPGMVLRYRYDENEVTQDDLVFSLDPAVKVTGPGSVSLRAFDSVGPASEPAILRYATRIQSFFVVVESTLSIQNSEGARLEPMTLEHNDGLGQATPLLTAWYRLRVYVPEKLRVEFSDHDLDPAWTARMSFSLFETDLYTAVLDTQGKALYEANAASGDGFDLNLDPGDYYLYAVDADGLTGRSFGIVVKRR